jgi:multidrug resistance efflux pump
MLEAQVQQTRQDLDRLLHGPDPDDIALTEARIREAQAALQAAQAALEDAYITAPFAGQVVSIPVKPHEWVAGGQTALVLADQTDWEVEVDDLEASEIAALQTGQRLRLTIDALHELELWGTIDSLSLIFDEVDGEAVYSATIRLEQSDPRLKWGMTARFGSP